MATATNFFKSAKVIEAKVVAGKKAKTVTEIEGIERYAAFDHTIKWMETFAKTVYAELKTIAMEKFIADGIRLRKQPENFDAVDGKGKANIQLRKRSAASALTDSQKELALEYGIPTAEVADRPDCFIIDTSVPGSNEWLEKNAVKLSAFLVKNGAPPDLIKKQDATVKTVTTEDSINEIFKKYHNDPALLAVLLDAFTFFGVKAKFDGDNDDALSNIQDYLAEKEEAEAA